MIHKLQMSQEDVAMYMRTSKSTVSRYEQAYRMMVERFLKIDEEKYQNQGEKKWSYFDEFFRQRELKDELKRNPDFGDDFCRWVGEGRLPKGEDVRLLSAILRHPEARKKLEKGDPKSALAEAKKLVEQAEPEQGSDFFKLLAKVKDSCSNAAQVKEILRIRTDKVARQRVLDTYTALVDFMQLADVQMPQKED